MRFRGIGTVAATLALALPATAGAANVWTVKPGGAPCTNVDDQRNCPSIQAAHDVAANDDIISIQPGSWPGATISKSGLTLTGAGGGEARIDGTIAFTGSGAFAVRSLTIRGGPGGSALSFTSASLTNAKTVQIESAILSGSKLQGSAEAPAINAANQAGVMNTITITARHVTVADANGAPGYASQRAAGGGAITARFYDSILRGTMGDATVADPGQNNDAATGNEATLFADPSHEDYHLRVGSPAIDQGGGQQAGEVTSDIDGEPRGAPWDRGADEFVNHPPTKPTLVATKTDPQTGEAVGFVAQGATDPDGALGDSVILYRWNFGAGATAETTSAGAAHAFATAGTYAVRVQAVDRVGDAGPPSDPVTITVTDPPPPPTPGPEDGNTPVGPGGAGLPGIPVDPTARPKAPDTSPPLLAITTPGNGQRVRLGRATPTLRGRTADESGVRRVELALLRLEGRRCLWYDGRAGFRAGPCTAVRWFRAVLDDFDWRYAFPRAVRPRLGSYVLAARAVDYLGHMSSAPTAVAFRYIR